MHEEREFERFVLRRNKPFPVLTAEGKTLERNYIFFLRLADKQLE